MLRCLGIPRVTVPALGVLGIPQRAACELEMALAQVRAIAPDMTRPSIATGLNPPGYVPCGREIPSDLTQGRYAWRCGWPIEDPEAAGDGCPCELEEPGSG